MRHPTSLALHAHWQALHAADARAGRPLPGFEAVDLAAIRAVLASVFVLDVGPRPDGVTVRWSGTRLDALFGRPLRGTAFGRLWAPGSSAVAVSALDAALGGARPAVAAARGGPPGRDAVDFELLLLPLDGGRHALGALAPFAAPGWMGLAAAAPLHLLPAGGRWPPVGADRSAAWDRRGPRRPRRRPDAAGAPCSGFSAP